MIAEIRLKNFRSYSEKLFNLSPGLNLVVGPNASGKTNLLEAVMVVCVGNSYRAPDVELIKHNHSWSRIEANTEDNLRLVKISHDALKTNKEFIIKEKTYKRLSLNHQLPIVLFEPNHLLMLTGAPERRRAYLDGLLDQITVGYKKTRNDYLRTLRQRNALLKLPNLTSEQIFPWNVKLSQLGGYIATARTHLINELNSTINETYLRVVGSADKLNLAYLPSVDIDSYESRLFKKLEATIELDCLRGVTSEGPHREDFQININSKPVAYTASRGETRSIAITLKSIEADILTDKLKSEPIILMDDVFSELDSKRTSQLGLFFKHRQSLVTTTDATKRRLFKSGAQIINTAVVNLGAEK